MKKNFFSLLLSLLDPLRQYPQTAWDLAILTAAKGCLKTIRALRYFYISSIQVMFCVFLFISGFFIMNVTLFLALFLLAPWSNEIKVLIVFLIGILEFGCALIWLCRFFSEGKWVKMAKKNVFVDKIIKKYYPLGPI